MYKHWLLLILSPRDHYGCRCCEAAERAFEERIANIPCPPAPRPTGIEKMRREA